MDNDSKSISIEHVDANVILDYLCPDNENSDVFDNAKKYFTQKNKNDRDIRAYTYALGEVFSNILTEKNNKKISLDNIEFVSRVETIRGTIKIIKLDKNNEFIRHYKEIQSNDNRIHSGDVILLAAFFCDADAKIFRTSDRDILVSTRIKDYANEHDKKIDELP